MREIITVEQVERLFTLLAIVLPFVGVTIGLLYCMRKGTLRRAGLTGLVIGLLGPLNLVLWRVYNGITDSLGMDTVRNLVVNLVAFIVLGAVAGVVVGYAMRGRKSGGESKDV